MAYTTNLKGSSGTFGAMMAGGFGIVTVMNAYVCDALHVDTLKALDPYTIANAEYVVGENVPNGDSTKDKLDEISKKILKAAENRQNAELNKYYKEMMSYGVKEIYPPAVYAKKTPQCPPVEIELNGKILKGSLCAQFGYVYKGKSYHHGYCR